MNHRSSAVYPVQGSWRLVFFFLDADIASVRLSSVDRVLHDNALMEFHSIKPSHMVNGFQQPLCTHEYCHVDGSFISIARMLLQRKRPRFPGVCAARAARGSVPSRHAVLRGHVASRCLTLTGLYSPAVDPAAVPSVATPQGGGSGRARDAPPPIDPAAIPPRTPDSRPPKAAGSRHASRPMAQVDAASPPR